MDNRSSDEINNHIVELEKDLQGKLKSQHIIQEQYSDVSREILVLKNTISTKEIEKKDLLKILNKSKFNVKQIELDLSIEKKNYWSNKNGGL